MSCQHKVDQKGTAVVGFAVVGLGFHLDGISFCGETCLEPSKFKIYHLFEKNLTAATGGPPNTTHPCSLQLTAIDTRYSVYNSTVTHGVPGVLAVTLDLYAPGKTAL